MHAKIFFCSFYSSCYFEKGRLFVLPTLPRFTHGTVKMGFKHSNFHQKTRASLWIQIYIEIFCFFSIPLSYNLFAQKLSKLSLLSFPSQAEKSFQSGMTTLCLSEYELHPSITKIPPNYYKQLTKWASFSSLTELTW